VVAIKPAWSFDPATAAPIDTVELLDSLNIDEIWRGTTGAGVRVAIVDSGIDTTHPAIGGAVKGWCEPVELDGAVEFRDTPHDDSCGHGTACAGLIHSLAPDAELYSVKVLGADMSGTGVRFAAGLHWAIEQGMQVVNLSLGTTKKEFFAVLHELADTAYFRRVTLVAAANNLPANSYPSLYASVISVACQTDPDPWRYCYNPAPPVEFSAPGIDVRVAWTGGGFVRGTGNSYAAPHITGLVARLLERWPQLTPFQIKTLLRAAAVNVRVANAASAPTPQTGVAQSAPR
jgi:subtilisin family serine protease